MGIITVLDEETISHIAAGEVVERAASVVKELVENAIDADAHRIKIELFADSTAVTRISVTDDGIGMSEEDALLVFRQHATSKISRPSDLAAIATLGFRGEAMASIAAVSQVTLVTKERGSSSPAACKITIHGGELIECTAAGAPEGTSVVVEGLFYNTPARRKFQKNVATELSHIYDMVERLALAHRTISFVLLYQGKERFRTYGNGSYQDVIAAVFGATFAKELVPVEGTYGLVKVSGLITRPGSEMKTTPSRLYLSINHRQISSRTIQWAVREGYGTLLPKGMYPAAFLDLAIDPRDVDVNVHPTKKEVRLSRERDVQRGVQDAVYCALHETPVFAVELNAPAPQEMPKPKTAQPRVSLPQTILGEAVAPYERRVRPVQEIQKPAAASLRQTDKQLRRTETFEVPETTEFVPQVLGQIADTYILAKNESGDLIVVDQHAAHERVMYDLLLARQKSGLAGQELLVPIQLHLTKRETAAIADLLDVLAEAGYLLEPFGKDVWMVRTVPVVSETLGDPSVIHEIITEALDKTSGGGEESVLDRVLKTAACRAVVKGATPMTVEQMQRLLRQLMATASPYTCPHGRPTTIVLTKERFAAMFLRT
ncbi:DNA mismatch repair endonuclease MutL [Methanorbis rubei]|uniref:DNA mismatch repair protein MutL n=1 Tax=Methanorbis rubei TaxID=3028300 RepID=A0AAE4MFX2_9EURY|nr:DNA mismatch repair protein MutL [Methanocorpusculaceae archaeon Cs1]